MKSIKLIFLLLIISLFSYKTEAQTPKPGSGGGGGGSGVVTGGACPAGQVARVISTAGVPTCVTITSAYVDFSILQAANNLSDLGSASTARTNLGIANFNLCTVDGSGNLSCPGTISSGVGSGIAGVYDFTQGTLPTFPANTFSIYAGTSIPTSYQFKVPSADPGAGVLTSDGGATPSNIGVLGTTGSGNVVRAVGPTIGLINGTGLPPAGIASIGADNIIGNFAGSGGVPGSQALPACPNDGGHALVYPSHTLTCETITGGGGGAGDGASIFNITAPTSITSTVTASLLGGSQTIAATNFITSSPMQIHIGGIYTLPSSYAGTATLAVFVDGSQIATTGAFSVPSTAVTNGTWDLNCQLTTYTTGSSGTYIFGCPIFLLPSSTSTITVEGASLALSSANSIDTTTSHTIDFKWTWSSAIGSPSITDQWGSAFVGGAPVTSVNTQVGAVTLFASNPQTSTYTTTTTDFKNCATIPVASGTFTITLVASGSQPPSGQCVNIINYGTGIITLARNGQNINGAASNLTGTAGSATAPTGWHVISDGGNYIASVIGGSRGSLISFGTYSSFPSSPNAGDVFYPSNSPHMFGWSGSAWIPYAIGTGIPLISPNFSGYSWVNQDNASMTSVDADQLLTVTLPTVGADELHNYQSGTTLTIPYTYTVHFTGSVISAPTNANIALMMLVKASGSGNIVTLNYFDPGNNGASNGYFYVMHWNSETSSGAGLGTYYSSPANGNPTQTGLWLRIKNDSTNRTFWASFNGVDYMQLFSHASGTFITENTDGLGFYTVGSALNGQVRIDSVAISNP